MTTTIIFHLVKPLGKGINEITYELPEEPKVIFNIFTDNINGQTYFTLSQMLSQMFEPFAPVFLRCDLVSRIEVSTSSEPIQKITITLIKTILESMNQGRKIEAIKTLRTATGWGLAEAKEYVEDLEHFVMLRYPNDEVPF